MKKAVFILLTLAVSALQAQQQPLLRNKRGILILPQKGQYSLGISANPFLSYFGNMFNNNASNSSPSFTFMNPDQTVFAKYMKANDLAYRASFRFGINNNSLSTQVMDLSPGAALNSVVSDVQKNRSTHIGLGFGLEKRRGNTRLQGIYGIEGLLIYSTGKSEFEYGNQLQHLDSGSIRVKSIRRPSVFTLGVRGFAGVEYFIAPGLSIGGEFGYGPSLHFRSASEQSTEQYDFQNSAATEELMQLSPKTRGFTMDTDNYGGQIKLQFYF